MATQSVSAPPTLEKIDCKRPKLASLQTPLSASYPSDLKSPFPGTPSFIKREENIKTPVTPPLAYLDFLKSAPTGLASPVTGTSSKFSFNDRPLNDSVLDIDEKEPPLNPPPTSQPSLLRTNSNGSESSASSIRSGSTESIRSLSGTQADVKRKATKPQSPRIIIPPSPFEFAKPHSARLPRGVQIPPSPMSPANLRSPMSARSLHEPYTASSLSATPYSASYSPTESESGSKTSRVSVKQVVTRTVTYSRTPLDPAPKGKRRKIEE